MICQFVLEPNICPALLELSGPSDDRGEWLHFRGGQTSERGTQLTDAPTRSDMRELQRRFLGADTVTRADRSARLVRLGNRGETAPEVFWGRRRRRHCAGGFSLGC